MGGLYRIKLITTDIEGLILWYPAFVIPDDAKKRLETGNSSMFGREITAEYDNVAKNIDVKQPSGTVTRTIGKTTYIANLHFKSQGQPFSQKLKRY